MSQLVICEAQLVSRSSQLVFCHIINEPQVFLQSSLYDGAFCENGFPMKQLFSLHKGFTVLFHSFLSFIHSFIVSFLVNKLDGILLRFQTNSLKCVNYKLTIIVNFENYYYWQRSNNPVRMYLFKVDKTNTWTSCKIFSKLILKTLEQRHWHHCGAFVTNFEHISHLFLVFLLLTLSI